MLTKTPQEIKKSDAFARDATLFKLRCKALSFIRADWLLRGFSHSFCFLMFRTYVFVYISIVMGHLLLLQFYKNRLVFVDVVESVSFMFYIF